MMASPPRLRTGSRQGWWGPSCHVRGRAWHTLRVSRKWRTWRDWTMHGARGARGASGARGVPGTLWP
eukprot:6398119-Pyramimonas_sp.AAC.1